VLGWFSPCDSEDGTAGLGYRVARHVAGYGVATAAVREAAALTVRSPCREKASPGRCQPTPGPAGPAWPGGKPGTWYQRDLAARDRYTG